MRGPLSARSSALLGAAALITASAPAWAMPFAAGGRHTCALDEAGTVSCWGANEAGQLGDGAVGKSRGTPMPVATTPGLAGTIQIGAGFAHSCALTLTGVVFCWGSNDHGQLGDGTLTQSSAPTQVMGLPPVIEIALGKSHSCALGNDAAVYCWGSNSAGQSLGTVGVDSLAPARLYRPGSPGGGAVHVAAGGEHTCMADAYAPGGAALCWGRLAEWQTGYGQAGEAGAFWTTPTRIVMTSAGQFHSCALDERGEIRCTGEYASAERAPERVRRASGFWSLGALQVVSGASFTCALRASGEVGCWGDDAYGQLGAGGIPWGGWKQSNLQRAVTVTGVSDAVSLSAGSFHACAALATGKLVCWGRNDDGQLGDRKPKAAARTPVEVQLASPARACRDVSCPVRCPNGMAHAFGVCAPAVRDPKPPATR